jgi:hypothetical protein
MKDLVQRARQLGGAMADAVRRAVDPPLDDDAKPIDVKRAIVEALEQQVEPAGGGRRILPGDRIEVRILAVSDEARPGLDAVLADLRDVFAARLRELQCDVPRSLAVDVGYVPAPLPEWADDQRLDVVVRRSDAAKTARDAGSREDAAVHRMTITVLRGEATQATATFTESVIRIGRSADPTDERGRPRFNHIAFLENDSPENRTVTRGHAMIRYVSATGEYRLFDEGSANGTRVVRSGEVVDLPKRDPVGYALRSGDEVQLGKAAIRIEIDVERALSVS